MRPQENKLAESIAPKDRMWSLLCALNGQQADLDCNNTFLQGLLQWCLQTFFQTPRLS